MQYLEYSKYLPDNKIKSLLQIFFIYMINILHLIAIFIILQLFTRQQNQILTAYIFYLPGVPEVLSTTFSSINKKFYIAGRIAKY